jgi:transcription termination factor 2
MYATIKFLRCKPWDDLMQWKSYMDCKKSQSALTRMQALLKSILLRRTKQQLIESGKIESLPSKEIKILNVTLSREERQVYHKVLSYSQSLFASFLSQQQDKNDNLICTQDKAGKAFKKFSQKYKTNHEVKAHEILTLILRLRQICCHPGLAKATIENFGENIEGEELEQSDMNESTHGILKQLENLRVADDSDDEKEGETVERVISSEDKIFNMDIPSSKLNKVLNALRENIVDTDDKAIVVSQWTSYLAVVRGMLEVEGISYCELNGTVPVKDRNDIVVRFNKPTSGIKVMLLSLIAGGVGMNLVGANFMFLLDLHWNPQLEQQAQDRIYRFGQKKDVKILKFVCNDTIEGEFGNI